jgi:hypothetical protein
MVLYLGGEQAGSPLSAHAPRKALSESDLITSLNYQLFFSVSPVLSVVRILAQNSRRNPQPTPPTCSAERSLRSPAAVDLRRHRKPQPSRRPNNPSLVENVPAVISAVVRAQHRCAPAWQPIQSSQGSPSNSLTPLQSADPKNTPVTPAESADPKTKHLKSFRIRTSEKRVGGG